MIYELAARQKIKVYRTLRLHKSRLSRTRLRLVLAQFKRALIYTFGYLQYKSPVDMVTLAAAGAIALILLAGIVKYDYIDSKKYSVPTGMCDVIREKALDECAIAFEDSYYSGGFSGKDMDFRRVKDTSRCQKLGTNMYYACLNNSKGN